MPKRTATPDEIARQIRDLVEQLNHATLTTDITAPRISATVQALLSALQHLPQTLDQLDAALTAQARADNIRMDNGDEPTAAVRTTRVALASTKHRIESATDQLQRAATPLFSMAAK